MAAVKDFAKSRVSGPEEWKVIREAYAETYPVRPLLNHIDRLEAAINKAIRCNTQAEWRAWVATQSDAAGVEKP